MKHGIQSHRLGGFLGGPALRPPPCVRCGLPPSLALHAHESDEEEVQAQEGNEGHEGHRALEEQRAPGCDYVCYYYD